METVQERLNKELTQGKSIADWAIGYYISIGNEHCFSINIPIFQFIEHSKYNTIVLIDYLGSMMWINIQSERVFYGWGINNNNSPSQKGKDLRRKLETINQN